MSRTFTPVTNYLEATTAAVAAPSIVTLTAWVKPSSLVLGTAISLGDSNSGHYAALGVDGTGRTFFETADPTSSDAFSTGTMGTGTWRFVAGVSASTTSHIAYLDATAGTTNTTSSVPAALDRTTVGALILNGSRISPFPGDVAQVAAWNIALSAGQITQLAAGRNPLTIAPGNLVGYWPVTGNNSPEPDASGVAFPLVLGGTPAKGATDPPVDPAPSFVLVETQPDWNALGPSELFGPNPFIEDSYPPFVVAAGNVIFDMAGVMAILNLTASSGFQETVRVNPPVAAMSLIAQAGVRKILAPGIATMNLTGIVPTKEQIIVKPPVAIQTWSAAVPTKLVVKYPFAPLAIINFVANVGTIPSSPVIFNMGTTNAVMNLTGIVPTKISIGANSARATLTFTANPPVDRVFVHPVVAPVSLSATVPQPRLRTAALPIAPLTLTAAVPAKLQVKVSAPTAILRFTSQSPIDPTTNPNKPQKIRRLGEANVSDSKDTVSR